VSSKRGAGQTGKKIGRETVAKTLQLEKKGAPTYPHLKTIQVRHQKNAPMTEGSSRSHRGQKKKVTCKETSAGGKEGKGKASHFLDRGGSLEAMKKNKKKKAKDSIEKFQI